MKITVCIFLQGKCILSELVDISNKLETEPGAVQISRQLQHFAILKPG